MRYPNLDLDELIGNSLVFGRNLGKSWTKKVPYTQAAHLNLEGFLIVIVTR